MPGPPPPPPGPPGPPPPPISGMNIAKKSSSSSAGGADMRGALLSQIQKGAKLKKVTTVDKSTPLGAGRIAGESNSASSSPVKSNKSSPDSSVSSPASSRGGPKGFISLTDELQHKLTLKKQSKQSPVSETSASKEVRYPNLKIKLLNKLRWSILLFLEFPAFLVIFE